MERGVFCFGRFRLFVCERLLLKGDVPVSLGSRAFDVLVALVARAGETVNRQDLFALVWPDVVVAKVNLRVHVARVRKVLGDRQDGNRFILSVAGRGYRFVAAVSRLQAAVPATPTPPGLQRALVGPGVSGRSIVAFAIAQTLATDLGDAVCFVDLAGMDYPAQVARAVASALGCAVESPQPLRIVLDYLREKEMLLVFDNCEHVFAGVAQLTELLLTEAPLVQVIVRSREALRLSPVTRSTQRSNAQNGRE